MKHVIEQGDTVAKLAYRHGLPEDKLWLHGDNGELRQTRDDPQLLLPGDELNVPDPEQSGANGAAGKKHQFRRKGVPARLRVRLLDERGEPRDAVDYELKCGGNTLTGTTDDEGWVDEAIAPDLAEATLTIVESGEEYELDVGGLDPLDEPTGAQARLLNLGFEVGAIDGDIGPRCAEALRRFQARYEIEQTGELDEATRAKLEEMHKS